MKIIRVEQQTPEWDRLHIGRITASMMDAVFAKPDTKAFQVALNNLVCDLRGIERLEEDEKPWFEHGKEHEADAILAFEFRHNVDTWRDAFLIHDELNWLGCSPDFLVGQEPTSGGEVKCRRTMDTYMAAIRAPENKYQRLNRGYYLQIQTALAITGFQNWWLVNHYIGGNSMRPRSAHRLIERDEEIIGEILERSAGMYEQAVNLAGGVC